MAKRDQKPEIVEEAPVIAPKHEATGLALFLERYLADQTKSPGELAPLQWRQPQATEQVSVGSKFGTLVWRDGTPAVFNREDGAAIVKYLRPIRPNDQINIQPANT